MWSTKTHIGPTGFGGIDDFVVTAELEGLGGAADLELELVFEEVDAGDVPVESPPPQPVTETIEHSTPAASRHLR